MKLLFKFLVAIFFGLFANTKSHATAQMGEIIIIDGQKFELLSVPIHNDSLLATKLNECLSEGRGTSCWRGYVGEWELKEGRLYLNKIMEPYEEIIIDTKDTFDAYRTKDGILASWFTGELRVVEGERIYRVHDAFFRKYSKETIYKVEKGCVVSKNIMNQVYREGTLSHSEWVKEVRASFDMAKFPELENANVYVSFRYSANSDGSFNRFTDITFNVDQDKIKDMEHLYIKELTKAFKTTAPRWDVFTINGEPADLPHWFSLSLNSKNK